MFGIILEEIKMDYIYSKEDALKIVSGDKFYNVLFDEIADIFSKKKLIEISNKLGIKAGTLYNLEPKQLLTLYNTLELSKNDGTEYKLAFENTVSAIRKKIQLFNKGVIKIPCEQVEDMEKLLKKVNTNKSTTEEKNEYKIAHKKLDEVKLKYDVAFNLSNITAESLSTSNKNVINIEQWSKSLEDIAYNQKELNIVDDIVNNTKVLGGYSLFGRKEIKQKDASNKLKANSDIDMWLSSVKLLTAQQLSTSNTEVTKEQFIDRFANNIETEYLKLAHCDDIIRGKNRFNDFKKIVKKFRKNKKININQTSIIAYVANVSNQNESFLEQFSKKIDTIKEGIKDTTNYLAVKTLGQDTIDRLRNYHKSFDEKASKKYGTAYNWIKDLAKNSAKSVGWGVAFGLSSTAFGPVGVSVVSAVSLARYGYPFMKDYLLEKKKYKEKGKLLTFKNYLAKNKTASLALMFNSLSVAIPIAGAVGGQFGAALNQNIALNFARANSAIGISLCQSVNEYRKSRKNGEGHVKACCKSAMNFVTGFVGFCIGNVSAHAVAGNMDIGGRDPASKVISFVKKDEATIATEQNNNIDLRMKSKERE